MSERVSGWVLPQHIHKSFPPHINRHPYYADKIHVTEVPEGAIEGEGLIEYSEEIGILCKTLDTQLMAIGAGKRVRYIIFEEKGE